MERSVPRALFGAALWGAVVLMVLPSPFETEWAAALLLLAALVLVPLAMELAGSDDPMSRLAAWIQVPAALCLGWAYLLPQGPTAAVLAAPWVATTCLMAVGGLIRLRRAGLRALDEVCIDAGFIYIVVGGVWAVTDRVGYRPLDFDGIIVLLTAIHFHYAGFVLPVITGLTLRRVKGWIGRVAGLAVIAGVPLVALGITATQLDASPWIECVAAWIMAAGGILTSLLLLQLTVRREEPPDARGLWAVAGVALLASMVLAALYGSRHFIDVQALDIPWMRAVHGTLNALGFGLAGLIAFHLAQRSSRSSSPE